MLRYRADMRTMFFVTAYFVLFTSLWVFEPTSWLIRIPSFAVLCVLSFMGAVTTHNCIHSPIFKYRWQNKIFQVILTNVYGHPVSSYVPGHNLSHHKHTQSRSDVMRTSKARFSWHLLNLFAFILQIAPSIMRADAQYVKMTRTRHPRWFRQLMTETAVHWTLQIGLFIIDWRKALILWLIPHIYAQWGIITFNLLQHDGADENSKYNHSRNFVNKTLNWWTYNNGFHTVHHMKPGLHWSLTPAAHAELVAPYIHPNLDQKSMSWYVFYTFFMNNRENFDGSEYVLRDEGPDEDWIPSPRDTVKDLGAESLDSSHGGAVIGSGAPVLE